MAILSDEFYYQPLRIDTINTRVYADIVAKEGDANGRGLLLTLTENGLMKDTTGITLILKWEHTSVGNQGLDNFEVVDPSKGLYKITYPTEMLNRGKVRAFIQIIDSGKLTGTRNIEITVDRGVGDDTAIASSDSFSALASALIEVQSWNDRIDDVEQDFIDRANNLDATYPTRLVSVEQQLAETNAQKVGGGIKAELEDLSATVIGAIDGTGGPFNLLSIPQDDSVTTKKTTFASATVNLANPENVVLNRFWQNTTPIAVGAITGHSTTIIDVKPLAWYSINLTYYGRYSLFATSSGNPLGKISEAVLKDSSRIFQTPANCTKLYITSALNRNMNELLSLVVVEGRKDISSYLYTDYPYGVEKDVVIPNLFFESTTIKTPLPLDKLDESVLSGILGKNLFDKTKLTSGGYVNYQNGSISRNALLGYSDYIPISGQEYYVLSGTKEQLAFFSDTVPESYISGVAIPSTTPILTPLNAKYVRLSMLLTQADTVQLEKGSAQTSYEPYQYKLKESQISDSALNYIKGGIGLPVSTDILIKTDGTGDFPNLAQAVESITDSGANKVYNIYLNEGDYDIFPTLTASQLSGFGITLPDYVNIIGLGSVTLKGEIPSGVATLDNTTRIATLNVKRNNKLKNLTITAKNMRYAVHDESSGAIKDWTRHVEDCTFIHYGNDVGMWQWTSTWGEGWSSGSYSRFDNCKFINYTTNPAYGAHNNVNFEKPAKHEFKNCQFLNLSVGGVAFRLGSMGSGKNDWINLVGCSFVGNIQLQEEVRNSGVGIDFEISGHSNQRVPYAFSYSNAGNFVSRLAFADEVYRVLNTTGNTISAKTPVKLDGTVLVSPLSTVDPNHLFYGIALENIANNSYGLVRVNGYIRTVDTNLASANGGDRIGIVNGQLAVVTSGEYVGICDLSGRIRLI